MAITAKENLIGAWAFFIGILLALVVGILSGLLAKNHLMQINRSTVLLVLAALGIIVGYFVSEKNVQTFLFAAVSVVIVSSVGFQALVLGAAVNSNLDIGIMISSIAQCLLALFIPAAIVVSIKTVFSISRIS